MVLGPISLAIWQILFCVLLEYFPFPPVITHGEDTAPPNVRFCFAWVSETPPGPQYTVSKSFPHTVIPALLTPAAQPEQPDCQ